MGLVNYFEQEKTMKKEQLNGLIRHALTVVGGALVAKGILEEEIMLDCVGAAMSVIGIVWSFVAKKK